MSETRHTPAPWYVEPCQQGGGLLRRGNQVGPGAHIQSSIQVLPFEDARLMGAAPDLLRALKDVLFEDKDKSAEARLETRIRARLAIAKAEG